MTSSIPILKLYFEKKQSPEEIISAGHDAGLSTTFSIASSRRE
jgi:hypothetical protein